MFQELKKRKQYFVLGQMPWFGLIQNMFFIILNT